MPQNRLRLQVDADRQSGGEEVKAGSLAKWKETNIQEAGAEF